MGSVHKAWYVYQAIDIVVVMVLISMYSYVYIKRRQRGLRFRKRSQNITFITWACGLAGSLLLGVRAIDPYGLVGIFPVPLGVFLHIYVGNFLYVVQTRTAYISMRLASTTVLKWTSSRTVVVSDRMLDRFNVFSLVTIVGLFAWTTIMWILYTTQVSDDAFVVRLSWSLVYGPLLCVNSTMALVYYFRFSRLVRTMVADRPTSSNASKDNSKDSSGNNTPTRTSPTAATAAAAAKKRRKMGRKSSSGRSGDSNDKTATLMFLVQREVIGVFALVLFVVTPITTISGAMASTKRERLADTLPNPEEETVSSAVLLSWAAMTALIIMLYYVFGHYLQQQVAKPSNRRYVSRAAATHQRIGSGGGGGSSGGGGFGSLGGSQRRIRTFNGSGRSTKSIATITTTTSMSSLTRAASAGHLPLADLQSTSTIA